MLTILFCLDYSETAVEQTASDGAMLTSLIRKSITNEQTTPSQAATLPPCSPISTRFLRNKTFEDYYAAVGGWKIVNTSEGFGPALDHTDKSTTSRYIIPAKNKAEYPLLVLLKTFCQPVCVSFYYSMSGTGHLNGGGLEVISRTIFNGYPDVSIASINSYSPKGWHIQKVTLR